jgi:putative oxidoreductase
MGALLNKERAMHESSALEVAAAERRRPARHWILFFMRLVLGGIFTFSAWSKIMAPQALADAIVGFDIIPESIALEAAIMLIWLELICGIFMLLGLWARATVIVITGMLTLFEIGLISVVVRGVEVNCGCFGQFSEMQVGWHTIIRNLIQLVFCALLLYHGSWKYSFDLIVKVKRRVKQGLPGWR